MNKLYIGFMSGTSLDGLDASIIKTDGKNHILPIENLHIPYAPKFRNQLKELLDFKINVEFFDVEQELTSLHISATYELLQKANLKNSDIEAIGFHGQTIYHNPEKLITWQIGNPFALATKTGIKTIYDFRKRDIAYGGQGAPLIPIFHKALMSDEEQPLAIVNIGGVANITYIDKDELIAFDTGPGNALVDDACSKYYGQAYDKNGEIARAGKADTMFVEEVLKGEYFDRPYPKSLDRNEFKWVLEELVANAPKAILREQSESKDPGLLGLKSKKELGPYLGPQPLQDEVYSTNLISTLTFLTASSITYSLNLLPKVPRKIYLSGGGVHNYYMKELIEEMVNSHRHKGPQDYGSIKILNINQKPSLNPDFIESQGFAYLAARFCNNLPSSFPSTTGVSKPTICGAAVEAI